MSRSVRDGAGQTDGRTDPSSTSLGFVCRRNVALHEDAVRTPLKLRSLRARPEPPPPPASATISNKEAASTFDFNIVPFVKTLNYYYTFSTYTYILSLSPRQERRLELSPV